MTQAELSRVPRAEQAPRPLVTWGMSDWELWRRWPRLVTKLAQMASIPNQPWKAAAFVRFSTLGPLDRINTIRVGALRVTAHEARQLIATAYYLRHELRHASPLCRPTKWDECEAFYGEEAERRVAEGARLGVVLYSWHLGERWVEPPKTVPFTPPLHYFQHTPHTLREWAAREWPTFDVRAFFEVER